MATKSEAVGVDVGNGNLKLWLDGRGILISTFQTKVIEVNTDNVIGGKKIEAEEIIDYLDLTFLSSPALSISNENERYVIGKYCLDGFTTGNEASVKAKKFEDDIPARTLLAGLAYEAIRRNPESKNVKLKVDMAMSLPLIDTNKDAYTKNQSRYIGQHVMIYHYPDGETTVKVTIDVEFATTNPEGGIGAYAVVYDANTGLPIQYELEIMGEVSIETLEDLPLLLLDIGSGTSELAASVGIEFDAKNSKGLPKGARDVINQINSNWNAVPEHENDQINSSPQFLKTYLNGRSVRKRKLTNFSKEYLYKFAEEIVADTAEQYKQYTKLHNSDVRIPVFGGGSLLLQSALEELFEKHKLAHAVIFVEDPIFVNARGSYLFTKMKAFQSRKQKYLESLKETIK